MFIKNKETIMIDLEIKNIKDIFNILIIYLNEKNMKNKKELKTNMFVYLLDTGFSSSLLNNLYNLNDDRLLEFILYMGYKYNYNLVYDYKIKEIEKNAVDIVLLEIDEQTSETMVHCEYDMFMKYYEKFMCS